MSPVAAEILNGSTAQAVEAIELSEEQFAIAAGVKDRKGGNLIVLARAGTGKTFLILQCLALVAGRAAVVAYNSKIAAEIKGKIAKAGHRHVDPGTFHAFGLRVLSALYPTAKVEGRGAKNAGYAKFTRMAKEVKVKHPGGEETTGLPQYLRGFCKRTLSMAMCQGFGIQGMKDVKNYQNWRDMIAHYRLDSAIADDNLDTKEEFRKMAVREIEQRLGRKLNAHEAREEIIKIGVRYVYALLQLTVKLVHEVISYDDMLYVPLYLNATIPTFDFVMVDEAQDSNPVRVEWARRMVGVSGRIMFVGDDKQAIYGFTGAMASALEIIRVQFKCTVYKMTVTFRCSQAVTRNAAKLVPDYRAAATNPEGRVEYINEEQFATMALVPGEDAIICRNTRPLVAVAFDLIRRDIPCHIEGKDVGYDMIQQIDMIDSKIKNIAKFEKHMDAYLTKETDKLIKADAEMESEMLTDKIETLRVVMHGLPNGSTMDDVKAKITSLFGDSADNRNPTVALMTAHKSKGLEYRRVFGWGVTTFMPSKMAKLDHEMEQEFNLEYVLKTRAIMEYWEVLVLPSNDNSKQKNAA